MADTIHDFSKGFQGSSESDWRQEVDKALKGSPFETLVRKTLDGIERGPLYTIEDLEAVASLETPDSMPFTRGITAQRDPYLPWGIRQTVLNANPKRANAHILEELEGGASELLIHLDPMGEKGCAIRTCDEFKTLLDGVMLDLARVYFAPNRMSPQYAALYIAALEESGVDPKAIKGGLGLSPIGQKAGAGGGSKDLPERLQRTSEVAEYAASTYPNLKTVFITASSPHEAGGSEAHEVAFACGGGASYMRTFIDHGLTPDQAADALEFSFAADADIHLTIAKLRAARHAWAQVAESFGVSESKRYMQQHVITSHRMLSARDPYTNLIRTSCAALGAVAGGADSLTVRPFTDAIGAPSHLSRRLARNLQILLMEESHMGKVVDPAGGSYLHESLGQRIAESGWAIFQEFERQGGMFEAVRAGWFQTEIAKTHAKRIERFKKGEETLIGVTQYAPVDLDVPETDDLVYCAPVLDAPIIEPLSFENKLNAARTGAQIRYLQPPEREWEPVKPVRIEDAFESS